MRDKRETVWRGERFGERVEEVVKWRPRGCLGVRLERVNRKLKPFKCEGEETVIYVSFIVRLRFKTNLSSRVIEETTRRFRSS